MQLILTFEPCSLSHPLTNHTTKKNLNKQLNMPDAIQSGYFPLKKNKYLPIRHENCVKKIKEKKITKNVRNMFLDFV